MNSRVMNEWSLWGLRVWNESGDDFGIVATWTKMPSDAQQQAVAFKASPADCVYYDPRGDFFQPTCPEEVDWENCYLLWELVAIPEPLF